LIIIRQDSIIGVADVEIISIPVCVIAAEQPEKIMRKLQAIT